jgi:hypothetical protein
VIGAVGSALGDDLAADLVKMIAGARVGAVAREGQSVQWRYQEHTPVEAGEQGHAGVEELVELVSRQGAGEQGGNRDLGGDRHHLGRDVQDLSASPGRGCLVDTGGHGLGVARQPGVMKRRLDEPP